MAKIMIVDDSDVMRVFIKNILMEAGHEVVYEVSESSKAIEAYRIYRPDIVTMDINMPGMDGLAVLKEIKKEFSSAKVIMITALDKKLTVFDALKSGAVNYLLKPLQEDKILETVNQTLINE
jgi:two-component system, chemotaxis family, chemotaxis protein CheY